ncbi:MULTISPECIES: hypothetical protein [unclassified Mesorhizobium]|jgi:hypothetical protein|uniref:hypothetical protein n=1 Tax=unclassified Mesorhizobium TaxID=325217 RepID=UPI000FC9B9C4|nr:MULTISPECIES: hypothetical protein [unclassified Mesorhizobium]RUT88023.1 hypothetical protein EOD14_08300 [Mesorhizobium sp. M7A.T.Ca.US.000.02.1.1]RUT90719.1 hypothetical protein EOD15_17760 [Mesorhizobium sp. M7A.T.Ca.US.000.02.2.1]
MNDTIALNKLRREWEADRLPLPQYLAGVQRLVAVDIERKQRAARAAAARERADRALLMLMPIAGVAFVVLTIVTILSR